MLKVRTRGQKSALYILNTNFNGVLFFDKSTNPLPNADHLVGK